MDIQTTDPKPRQKRTEKMTASERAAFRKWLRSQDTKIDASEILQISLPTIDRIIALGQGRPSSIAKIRKAISHA